jgi:hypothetical protein
MVSSLRSDCRSRSGVKQRPIHPSYKEIMWIQRYPQSVARCVDNGRIDICDSRSRRSASHCVATAADTREQPTFSGIIYSPVPEVSVKLHHLFEAKNRLLHLHALHMTCSESTLFRVARPAVRRILRLLVPFTLEARPEVLAYDRTSPCTNSRRPKSLPSLPDLPAPSSSWRDETGGLVTLSRASDAENIRSDVCLQILPASAKGMFRQIHRGPT